MAPNPNCTECTAKTKRRTTCLKTTCRGDMCWIHLKRNKDLRIKPAPGMGLGLYTTRTRYPGALNVSYTGEYLTGRDVEERYPDPNRPAQYVLCNENSKQCIDGRKVTSSFARFINHSGREPNIGFGVFRRNPPHFKMHVLRYIPRNGELLVDYGPHYDMRHP